MRNKFILLLMVIFGLNSAFSQSSENTAPFRFEKKEVKGFMKLKKEQIDKSAYNKGFSLCKKYDYISSNELTVGQSIEGDILFRFVSSNNEETAVIVNSEGKMIEVIIYLNEELKPYNTITDIMNEKEYLAFNGSGEFGAAVKFITRDNTWIEVVAKRKSEEKSPILILFFSEKLKFIREEEKE